MLLGPTGAGKTTTLRLIAGLETPRRRRRHRSAGGRSTALDPGAARCHLRVPAVFALPAPDGARQPGLPAALADPADARATRSPARSPRSPRCCASPTSSTTRRPRSRAARCSASPSAARWCASPSIYLMDEPLSLARRQAARRPAARAQAHPARPRRHLALRHPRPDRGDDDGDPCRRARPRAGWCSSAPRARSTRTRSASMSPAASASRGSTSCPPTCFGRRRPPAPRTIGLRPEHIRQGEGAGRHASTRVEHLGDQTRLHLSLQEPRPRHPDRPPHRR